MRQPRPRCASPQPLVQLRDVHEVMARLALTHRSPEAFDEVAQRIGPAAPEVAQALAQYRVVAELARDASPHEPTEDTRRAGR